LVEQQIEAGVDAAEARSRSDRLQECAPSGRQAKEKERMTGRSGGGQRNASGTCNARSAELAPDEHTIARTFDAGTRDQELPREPDEGPRHDEPERAGDGKTLQRSCVL
jgi:hypothetical protein